MPADNDLVLVLLRRERMALEAALSNDPPWWRAVHWRTDLAQINAAIARRIPVQPGLQLRRDLSLDAMRAATSTLLSAICETSDDELLTAMLNTAKKLLQETR